MRTAAGELARAALGARPSGGGEYRSAASRARLLALKHDAILRWPAAHENADSSLRSRRRLVLKPHWLPADTSVGSR